MNKYKSFTEKFVSEFIQVTANVSKTQMHGLYVRVTVVSADLLLSFHQKCHAGNEGTLGSPSGASLSGCPALLTMHWPARFPQNSSLLCYFSRFISQEYLLSLCPFLYLKLPIAKHGKGSFLLPQGIWFTLPLLTLIFSLVSTLWSDYASEIQEKLCFFQTSFKLVYYFAYK